MKRASEYRKWFLSAMSRHALTIARYEGDHHKIMKLAFNAGLRAGKRAKGKGKGT